MEEGDVTCLRARADEGSADAQFNYGLLLEKGDGFRLTNDMQHIITN
jgi:TPR repeat protein